MSAPGGENKPWKLGVRLSALLPVAALMAALTVSCAGPSQAPDTASEVTSSTEAPGSREAEPPEVQQSPEPGQSPDTGESPDAEAGAIELTSSAFTEGGFIPVKYSCDGENISPPLEWSDAPGAKTYALIADDPDAPSGIRAHWVLWNQPAPEPRLSEGVPTEFELPIGARQGLTTSLKTGYGGPCPPPGGPAHRYFFKVYALDTELELGRETGKEGLLKAMEGHILGQGELMGRFER